MSFFSRKPPKKSQPKKSAVSGKLSDLGKFIKQHETTEPTGWIRVKTNVKTVYGENEEETLVKGEYSYTIPHYGATEPTQKMMEETARISGFKGVTSVTYITKK